MPEDHDDPECVTARQASARGRDVHRVGGLVPGAVAAEPGSAVCSADFAAAIARPVAGDLDPGTHHRFLTTVSVEERHAPLAH